VLIGGHSVTIRRPIWTAVALLLVGAIAAGCAALGAAIGTAAALQGAGYQDVHVNITTTAGTNARGNVSVSYSSGPTGEDGKDSQRAERIVWRTLRYRFGTLVIFRASGQCTGPVCVSQSNTLARATYSELAARLGPRPAGLESAGARIPFSLPGWAIGLGVAVAVCVVVAAAVVLALVLRSRQPASRL
jgi:hypothetical protein